MVAIFALMALFSLLPCAADFLPAFPKPRAFVIPIEGEISEPNLYILRRGVKQATAEKADVVLLDMKTPGGALDVTFEMLKTLEKFPGKTVTFVNDEAISAGALISAGSDEIFFHPRGVIGAAAPVMATGGEIDATMRAKIVSYLKARVRSVADGKGYRGDVVSAMIDQDMEFKIGERIIKPKGELLSLTATEAMAEYGDPPTPLLGSGIAENVDDVLAVLHGQGNTDITRLEITWSENVAKYLAMISPVLMGLGMLALFIEFKTPGFGFFGIAGIVLLLVVFLGHNVAGLSGHEALLAFLLGVALIFAELLFFPGLVFPALAGAVLVLGSLVWATLDVWPNEWPDLSGDALLRPVGNLLAALAIAGGGFLALLRFLPGRGPFARMVLQSAIGGTSAPKPLDHCPGQPAVSQLIGKRGKAVTGLFPSGQVEIDGHRYEARLAVGHADPGTPVVVTRVAEFSLTVEVAQ